MNDRSIDRADRRSYANPPDFETEQVAEQRWTDLIAHLERRPESDRKGKSELLKSLRHCGDPKPCKSGACPKCNRAFRLRLHQQAQNIVPRDAELLRVSLIPKAGRVEVGDLPALDISTWVKSRQRALARALPNGAMFIGGVDISLNTWKNRDLHWCFHIYGFVILPCGWGVGNTRQRMLLRRSIAKHCPLIVPIANRPTERPLRVARLARQDFDRKFLYAYKSQFYLRSRYPYQKRNAAKCSSNVVPHSLPIDREIDLAKFLGRYPVGSRLILVGVRRQGLDANFRLTKRAGRQSSG